MLLCWFRKEFHVPNLNLFVSAECPEVGLNNDLSEASQIQHDTVLYLLRPPPPRIPAPVEPLKF